jgi:uncharacterized protein (TIGR02186 family)
MALKSRQARLLHVVPMLVLLSAVMAGPTASAQSASPVTLELSPKTIEMGAFYNGARLRMEGTVPSGAKVIVVLRGASKDEVFNKKERVGPIWVNVDKVHVTGPPSLFLRFMSEDVHTFLDRQTIDSYALDELSIRNRMQIRTERGITDPDALRRIGDDYIDLKKKDGSYRRLSDRVQTTKSADGQEHYSLEFGWPKLATPGSYQVEVYACRDGRIVGQSGTVLPLVEVGFPAFMANAAKMHAYWYGIFAVILAVIAGFGIDAIAVLLGGGKKRVPAHGHSAPQPQPAQRAMAAKAGAGGGQRLAQDGGQPILQPDPARAAVATASAPRSSDMGP